MSVRGNIVNKYSDPLPCRSCKYAFESVGGYSRCESAFCEKYDDADNMKPYGVLFANKPCDFYEPEDE